MREFESFRSSQAVRWSEKPRPIVGEMPTIGGLLRFGGLQAPNPGNCEANSPKVSRRMSKYSHLRETRAGDRVRSPPRGGCGLSRQFESRGNCPPRWRTHFKN